MDSRRDFIRKTTMGIAGISLFSKVYPLHPNPTNKVVIIKHKNVIGSDGHARQNIANEMVNRGMTELTGTSNLSDAWLSFFSPEDIIGMKLNVIRFRGLTNSPLASHYPVACKAILNSCSQAGIPQKQFVLWDRMEEELEDVGFSLASDTGNLRIMATDTHIGSGKIGFHPRNYSMGSGTTQVSRIMTDICTAAINVPVIKLHGIADITISLKNHYGTINNPWEFHSNMCTNPGIPELNALPVIRKKERLIIVNGLQAIYRDGNVWRPNVVWPYGGMVFGTDPVAVDRVCLDIINEQRAMKGMDPIGMKARHLELSEKLGIGTADMGRINLQRIELS